MASQLLGTVQQLLDWTLSALQPLGVSRVKIIGGRLTEGSDAEPSFWKFGTNFRTPEFTHPTTTWDEEAGVKQEHAPKRKLESQLFRLQIA